MDAVDETGTDRPPSRTTSEGQQAPVAQSDRALGKAERSRDRGPSGACLWGNIWVTANLVDNLVEKGDKIPPFGEKINDFSGHHLVDR